MEILAQLADCPPNRPKSGEEHKGRCVTFCGAPAEAPGAKAHPPGVFYSPVRRTGGVRLSPPTARRAGGGWKTISRPGPEGQDGGRLFLDTFPSLAQHWAYGFIPGFMVPFWLPSGLWFRSGSIPAYGFILAPFWPYGFILGFKIKNCARQRRLHPEHPGQKRPFCVNLINRGLPFSFQQSTIAGEENLIVRWAWRVGAPHALCGQTSLVHTTIKRTTSLLYSLTPLLARGEKRCVVLWYIVS